MAFITIDGVCVRGRGGSIAFVPVRLGVAQKQILDFIIFISLESIVVPRIQKAMILR